MNHGTVLLIALIGALTALLAGVRSARWWLAGLLTGALAAALVSGNVLVTGSPWVWRNPLALGGEPLHLRLDGLSAWFLMLIAIVGGAVTVYAHQYWDQDTHPLSARRGRCWWAALLLSMGLVVLCSNGLHFLLAWEAFTLCGFFLIRLDSRRGDVRAAGWLYLAASHAGTLCLFGLFATLAAKTGSWELSDFRGRPELAPLFWLVLAGFGVKAGIFGLHIWLPSAHANAPSHVSAILSGVAIKLGIYGIVRFSGWLPVPVSAAWVVTILGAGSAVLGVVFALGQHDLKRLLAYHSVENIGIILLGVGFGLLGLANGDTVWGRLAFAGGLLHVWNHGLFKSLLFLGAGSVLHATGTREMSRLGGLWRPMPWTTALFALGAVAISGLPPLNGFVSEFLIYLGLFEVINARALMGFPAMAAVVLLAMTGALALACFVKVCGVVFLGEARSHDARKAHECGALMRGSMLSIAGLCVVIGLAPIVFWKLVSQASMAWHPEWTFMQRPPGLTALTVAHPVLVVMALAGSAWLLRRVCRLGIARSLTWGCGYAAPAASQQYTAGSFARIITAWFGWILRRSGREDRPRGCFPPPMAVAEHSPETVLECVFKPVANQVLRVAAVARGFQHGRLQSYLLYLVAGVLLLAVITAWTISR